MDARIEVLLQEGPNVNGGGLSEPMGAALLCPAHIIFCEGQAIPVVLRPSNSPGQELHRGVGFVFIFGFATEAAQGFECLEQGFAARQVLWGEFYLLLSMCMLHPGCEKRI